MKLDIANLPASQPSSPVSAPGRNEGASDGEVFAMAQALIGSRQNVSPRRLVEPGPSAEQLTDLMHLAAAAPDHGSLNPWRFIVVPVAQRTRLAEVFALALLDRDPQATVEQIEAAREKAHRAPLLLIAVACLGLRDPDIAALERMVSMGAAIQNLLLGAHALGFGVGLTSGQAMTSPRMRQLCGLADGEVAVCCVNIGTVSKRKPPTRTRPSPSAFVTELPPSADLAER
jgi:nitroreductase